MAKNICFSWNNYSTENWIIFISLKAVFRWTKWMGAWATFFVLWNFKWLKRCILTIVLLHCTLYSEHWTWNEKIESRINESIHAVCYLFMMHCTLLLFLIYCWDPSNHCQKHKECFLFFIYEHDPSFIVKRIVFFGPMLLATPGICADSKDYLASMSKMGWVFMEFVFRGDSIDMTHNLSWNPSTEL